MSSTALFLLLVQGVMEILRQWGRTIYQVAANAPDRDVSFSVALFLFLPLLIHCVALMIVVSQALLKWPPAIFPNPSYMLFGAVSSKPHLQSPKQRGCHCALTGSIDFLWEVRKFCLMASHLNGLIPLVIVRGVFLVEVWGGGKLTMCLNQLHCHLFSIIRLWV